MDNRNIEWCRMVFSNQCNADKRYCRSAMNKQHSHSLEINFRNFYFYLQVRTMSFFLVRICISVGLNRIITIIVDNVSIVIVLRRKSLLKIRKC
jgi:hypothetical protein